MRRRSGTQAASNSGDIRSINTLLDAAGPGPARARCARPRGRGLVFGLPAGFSPWVCRVPACGRRGPALRFRLLDLPGSLLRPVPSSTVAEVNDWWSDRLPLRLPREALPLLDAWAADNEAAKGSASTSSSHDPGPGRSPEDIDALTAFLRQKAEAGESFRFNVLWRERQGGRSYPFVIDGYARKLTISRNAYDAAGKAGPRHLLAAIRRDVRGCMEPPGGWTLLVGDFVACHPHLGLALSGDAQLARDLRGDFHQLIGDMAARKRDRATRRRVGKQLNNCLLFGASPAGLRHAIVEELGDDPGLDRAKHTWEQWWARYPALASFRDEVISLVAQAQQENLAIEIVAPSGWTSRFGAGEVRGVVGKGKKPAPGPKGAWRSVFSAMFRAVEGDLLDRTLAHFHESRGIHGGRPALPLYDGLYVAARHGDEGMVADALKHAAGLAATELSVPEMRMVVTP